MSLPEELKFNKYIVSDIFYKKPAMLQFIPEEDNKRIKKILSSITPEQAVYYTIPQEQSYRELGS